MPAKKHKEWVCLVGMNLADGTRLEEGDPFPGKPPGWAIDLGYVEEIE